MWKIDGVVCVLRQALDPEAAASVLWPPCCPRPEAQLGLEYDECYAKPADRKMRRMRVKGLINQK